MELTYSHNPYNYPITSIKFQKFASSLRFSMFRAGFCCLLLLSLLFVVSLAQEDECKPVQTVENFDIEEYACK